MKVSDEELIDRLRVELATWAEDEPVELPTLTMLGQRGVLEPIDPPAAAHPSRRRALLVAAALVALAGAAAVVVIERDPPATVVDVGPTRSGAVEIPVGHRYGVRGLDVADDAVWVTSQFDEELYRIDPATNRVVATFPIPSHVEGVRDVAGWLWLSRYEPNELVKVDPTSGAVIDRLSFDSQPNLASDGERLWVVADRNGEATVVEIDPVTTVVIGELPLDGPSGFALADGDDLWVANMGGTTVSRVDVVESRVTSVIDVGGEPRGIVAASGSIWVAVNQAGVDRAGSIVRLDPESEQVIASITTGRFVHSLAAVGDQIWATNFLDGTVSVIDSRSGELVASSPIGNRPGGVAAGHGSVWLTPHRRNVLLRIDPASSLEEAAAPDLARAVVLDDGLSYIRCSGSGRPTVVVPGNVGEGAPWTVVEARVARVTRVCAYEPIGVADPAERARPAASAADDLATTLATVGEVGPFVIVGEAAGALDARMFAGTHSDLVAGVLLVNGVSADYMDRLRAVLSDEVVDRLGLGVGDQVEVQRLDESSRQADSVGGLGDVALVVLNDAPPEPADLVTGSNSVLGLADAETISEIVATTRREQAALSTRGVLVEVPEAVSPSDIVDALLTLLG